MRETASTRQRDVADRRDAGIPMDVAGPAMVRRAYSLAARSLGTMVAPVAVVMVPLVLVALLLPAVGGGIVVLVNGDFALIDRPSVAWAAGATIVAGALVAGATVVTSIGVIMAAGEVVGRRVSVRAAVTLAARRAVRLASAVVAAWCVTAGVLAAGVTAGRWLPTWIGIAVSVMLLLAVAPYAIALPAVVLENLGFFRALRRAHRVIRMRRTEARIGVTVGLIVVPAAVVLAARAMAWPLDALPHAVTLQTVPLAAALLALPFQAATLAVVFLNQRFMTMAPGARLAQADVAKIAALLPDCGAPRHRWWTVVAASALLLPGVLVGINPSGLPTFDRQGLDDGHDGAAAILERDQADRPVPMTASSGYVAQWSCADRVCARHEEVPRDVGEADVPGIGTATLSDGRIAVAAWEPSGLFEMHQRLFTCDPGRCAAGRTLLRGPGLSESVGTSGESAFVDVASAAAVDNADRLVIASLAGIEHDGPTLESPMLLRLITCADPECTHPRTVRLARTAHKRFGLDTRPLEVAVGPDGTPVVALLERTGAVVVAACDTRRCARPIVTRHVVSKPSKDDQPIDPWGLDVTGMFGLDLAIRPDGSPVVAYSDPHTGAVGLLSCRTSTCAYAHEVTLTEPDLTQPGPAVVVDATGQPMVATYDPATDHLVVISCQDPTCAHRDRVALAKLHGEPSRLDIALGRDERPQVLWGETTESPGRLDLITCARPDCR